MWSDFRKLIKEMRQHDDRAEIGRCWNDIKGFIKNDMPIRQIFLRKSNLSIELYQNLLCQKQLV